MYVINKDLLNQLEKTIYSVLFKEIRQNNNLSITEAAELCGCSPSKISKFVQKLGFKNYKEYSGFISGKVFSIIPDEKERLKRFLDDFDPEIIDHFIRYLQKFEKIILFGYGPSFIVGQYFEYKLRSISDVPVWAVPHETAINDLLSDHNLVIIFSVTGQFRSFNTLYENILSKKGKVAFVLEEGHTEFAEMYDFVIFLSKYMQDSSLLPHEKTRTTFFTFIEEVIKQLSSSSFKLRNKKK